MIEIPLIHVIVSLILHVVELAILFACAFIIMIKNDDPEKEELSNGSSHRR